MSKYLPEVKETDVTSEAVDIDINMPMSELRTLLSQYPVTTRLNLSGTLVVARDQAHAKILERVDSGEGITKTQHEHLYCFLNSCTMSVILNNGHYMCQIQAYLST